MTGPEHYREAERLADLSAGQEMEHAMFTLGQAQVHATLALAAATALPTVTRMGGESIEVTQWSRVLSTAPGGTS